MDRICLREGSIGLLSVTEDPSFPKSLLVDVGPDRNEAPSHDIVSKFDSTDIRPQRTVRG